MQNLIKNTQDKIDNMKSNYQFENLKSIYEFCY